jgi:hypothetical protein
MRPQQWTRLFLTSVGFLSTLTTATSPSSAVDDHDSTVLSSDKSADASWPYNLPPTVKYFPEHGALVRREENAARVLLGMEQAPGKLRKMSEDPNEKFFLGYWDLPNHVRGMEGSGQDRREIGYEHNDTAIIAALEPAVFLHSRREPSLAESLGFNLFRRAFQCPAGTNACSSIGTSDLCCPNGQTCVKTSDGVGCCPNGQTCGNNVASCDTGAGYKSCPNSSNGGCCIPGAACLDTGCVFYGTQTVTTNLPPATVTSTSSFVFPSTTIQAATTTVTITGAGTTQTTTIISPTTIIVIPSVTSPTSTGGACTSGYNSCPASLGGGCCPTDQACASGTQCTATASSSTSDNASAPVRGTSILTTTSTTPPTATTSTSYNSFCPTGYYMCSAVYLGGCCRVDRDCHTLSCPPTASTTAISSAVATVVIPAPTTTGSCANGWYICNADSGGGCCPLGFACARESCAQAQGSGTLTTAKGSPTGNAAAGGRARFPAGGAEGVGLMGLGMGLAALAVGVGMVVF